MSSGKWGNRPFSHWHRDGQGRKEREEADEHGLAHSFVVLLV